MTAEAANRVLLPRTEEFGVTGFVAATGKSYAPGRDTNLDPLYLPGAAGAHSSLTVPLLQRDQVIGTFNVESQQPNTFDESDLQYAELFCRDVAGAPAHLELLSAEQSSATTRLAGGCPAARSPCRWTISSPPPTAAGSLRRPR